jgi:uncharacterized membrane protein
MNWLHLIRWFHILAGAAWLGEVVMINVVLVPTLSRLEPAVRGRVMAVALPRVFRLASVLSAVTVLTGFLLFVRMTGGQLEVLVASRWGRSILVGGALGLALTLFHFVAERRFEPALAGVRGNPGGDETELVLQRMRVIPRVGLGVLLITFVLMMYAARGL